MEAVYPTMVCIDYALLWTISLVARFPIAMPSSLAALIPAPISYW
jgi:hypothetical protein